MKDNDMRYKLHLHADDANFFREQLTKDSEFLRDIKVMDYSLLIGVHKTYYTVRGSGSGRASDASDIIRDPGSEADKLLGRKVEVEVDPEFSPRSSRASSHTDAPSLPFSSSASNTQLRVERRCLQVKRIVGPMKYYIGIVDFQQQYTFSKKCEYYFKSFSSPTDAKGLSCIEPKEYQKRFDVIVIVILQVFF